MSEIVEVTLREFRTDKGTYTIAIRREGKNRKAKSFSYSVITGIIGFGCSNIDEAYESAINAIKRSEGSE